MSSNAITIPGTQIQARPWVDELHQWVTTVDHKRLGILYILSALLFLVDRWSRGAHHSHSADAFAQQLRFSGSLQPNVHHAWHNHDFLRGHAGHVWICELPGPVDDWCARHGVSTPECIQLLAIVSGGLLLYFSFFGGSGLYGAGSAPDVGWWSYAPLGARAFSPGHSSDYWTLALLVSGFGSIGTAINIIATVLCMRCPGMKLSRMPLLAWLNLVHGRNGS